MSEVPVTQPQGRGILISFEGGDGAGKSALTARLAGRLEAAAPGSVAFLHPKSPVLEEPYVAAHMEALASALWEGRGLQGERSLLADLHWVHLAAAWFHAVDQHVVQPALQRHSIVVLDSWYHKLLARFRMKGADVGARVAACYETVSQPDLTFLLDIDPVVAADRKDSFGFAETGNFDGFRGVTRTNFIAYQSLVRRHLYDLAAENGWMTLNAGGIKPEDLCDVVFSRIAAAVPALDLKQAASVIGQPLETAPLETA